MKDVVCLTPACPDRDGGPFMDLCDRYVRRFDVDCEHMIAREGGLFDNIDWASARLGKYKYVFFIEDDDWYAPDYLSAQLAALKYSRRFLIGYDPTIYYHIVSDRSRVIPHFGRASLYSTGFEVEFFTHLWESVKREYGEESMAGGGGIDIKLWELAVRMGSSGVTTVGQRAVGIKHGLTKSIGNGHELLKSNGRKHNQCFLERLIGKEDAYEYRTLVGSMPR